MSEHVENASEDDYLDSRPDDRTVESAEDRGTGGSACGPSRMGTFGQCARKGRYHYHEGLILRKDKPNRLGGRLVHLGLAYYHAHLLEQQQRQGVSQSTTSDVGTLKEIMGKTLKAVAPIAQSVLPRWFHEHTLQDALVIEAGPEAPPTAIPQANAAISHYVLDAKDRPSMTELFVEHEFQAKLRELDSSLASTPIGEAVVTCRSDRVLEDTQGYVWIEDHKTKGRGRSRSGLLPAWSRYNEHTIDWQALVNLHIVRRRLSPRFVKGFIIHRIQRVPPFDHDYNVLRVSALAYERAPKEMARCVALDREAESQYLNDEPTPASYWACYDRFGLCDYAPICSADGSAEAEAIKAADYKTVVTAANLKKAAATAAVKAAKIAAQEAKT